MRDAEGNALEDAALHYLARLVLRVGLTDLATEACLDAGCDPRAAEVADGFSVPVEHVRHDHVALLLDGLGDLATVLDQLDERRQLAVGQRTRLARLRGLDADHLGRAVDVLPAQAQRLALPPACPEQELHEVALVGREGSSHALVLGTVEETFPAAWPA